MVVGMNEGVRAELSAQNLVCAVGKHLVCVHVERHACSCLEDIHDKLADVVTVEDLLRGLHDRVRLLGRQQAELAIRLCRRQLDHRRGAHQVRACTHAADGEVGDGAGGLRSVESRSGYVHEPE